MVDSIVAPRIVPARLPARLPGGLHDGLRRLAGRAVPPLLALLLLTGAPQAQARLAVSADPPQLCEAAARRAAAGTGVPFEVLLAIAHVETGRMVDGRTRPWPWALNIAGRGVWAPTRDDALRQMEAALGQGIASVDVGCFQINHRWHGHAFVSLAEMMDPQRNATHAAKFLADLYTQLGDWTLAAGAYHSRTPEFARPYAQRFAGVLAALRGGGSQPEIGSASGSGATASLLARINGYTLLRPGKPVSAGSLMTAAGGAQPLLAAGRPGRPFIAGMGP